MYDSERNLLAIFKAYVLINPFATSSTNFEDGLVCVSFNF